MLNKDLGVNLTVIDASDLFLSRLEGVEDPERKRKIIGNTFIEVFEKKAAELEASFEETGYSGEKGKIEWLLQGTLFPDVIESLSFKGPSATIKTHHNVGGLLENMKLKLIEPLRELFKGSSRPPSRFSLFPSFSLLSDLSLKKILLLTPSLLTSRTFSSTDEVRALGRLLNIPEHLVGRHPFPGPGLAIRILGPVTRDQVAILQKADAIYIEEIRAAGLYDQISQAFAALLPVKAVGVAGDKRTYDQVRSSSPLLSRTSNEAKADLILHL